jgi:2-polyprenyl-6-methoxyphenol hydroxylase-like FAD-dependent oxidoreductase
MNLSLRKEKLHEPPESTSSPQALKKTQPEEFDLVILGGGTGSTIAAWTFAGEGKHVAVVDRKYIAAHVRTSRACRARTSSIARKSHRTFAEARNSGSHTTASRSTCRASVTASARWCQASTQCIWTITENRSGVRFGDRTVHSSEDAGGRSPRWNHPSPAWHQRDRQYRYSGHIGRNSRSC